MMVMMHIFHIRVFVFLSPVTILAFPRSGGKSSVMFQPGLGEV